MESAKQTDTHENRSHHLIEVSILDLMESAKQTGPPYHLLAHIAEVSILDLMESAKQTIPIILVTAFSS